MELKRLISQFTYRIEPKPGGGFIAHPADPGLRWVEWEIRRILHSKSTEGCPGRRDLEVWLAKERDGLSWNQIALKFCGAKTSACASKVRRTYERVQRLFRE